MKNAEKIHRYNLDYSTRKRPLLSGRNPLNLIGRGDWIRTSDPLRPRQVRYQAALRPDDFILSLENLFRSPPRRA